MTVLGTLDIFAQSEDIPVSFTLEAPQPTCGVTKLQDINFGVLGRPPFTRTPEDYGEAFLDDRLQDDHLRTLRGVTHIGGTPTIGKLKITAGNANTLTLTWGFPRKLVMVGGDHELKYWHGHYSHSRNENGPWIRMISRPTLTFPFRGVEAAGTHYIQIGSSIFIYSHTEPGHYTNTMTLSVSCPE